MSEWHGGSDTIQERLEAKERRESEYQDRKARERHASQGFFKRAFTTPDDYREPDRPVGDTYYHG